MESRGAPDGDKSQLHGPLFTTTHWSVVLAAGEQHSDAARVALENLCRAYWYPLYVFVRRHGYGPQDAQDLTQDFFARVIGNEHLTKVRPEKGRFRSFLLTCLQRFLADARDRAQAQKHGGGRSVISLDDSNAEARYQLEPQDELSPDRIFDRRWAYALLETVMKRLQAEFSDAGKGVVFDALRPFLAGEAEGLSDSEVAGRLALSEAAAKMTATRMRRRYRQLLRAEVANTVATQTDVDEELRYLFAALR